MDSKQEPQATFWKHLGSAPALFILFLVTSTAHADPTLPKRVAAVVNSTAVFENPGKPRVYKSAAKALADYLDWRLAFLDPLVEKKIRQTLKKSSVEESATLEGKFIGYYRYEATFEPKYRIAVPGNDPWITAYLTAHEVEHQIQTEAVRPYKATFKIPGGEGYTSEMAAFDRAMEKLNFYSEAGAITAEFWFLRRMPDEVRAIMLESDFPAFRRRDERLSLIRRVWRNAGLPADAYLAAEWRAGRYSPKHFGFMVEKFDLSEFARFQTLFSARGCKALLSVEPINPGW